MGIADSAITPPMKYWEIVAWQDFLLPAGLEAIAARLQGMVGDVGVDAAQGLCGEGRRRRPTISGDFHRL